MFIKNTVNAGNWAPMESLEAISDNPALDIDGRIPAQLLLDFLSCLSEPILDLDKIKLIHAYNTDHRMDVNEDAQMPAAIEENVNRKQKRSRWTVKRAMLVNELIKADRKSYQDNVKVVKKKGGKHNKTIKKEEKVRSGETLSR